MGPKSLLGDVMKEYTGSEVFGIVVLCSAMMFGTGVLVGKVGWRCRQSHVTPNASNDKLVKVRVVEICNHNYKPWYLLETEDKQRCYIDCYRGQVSKDYFYLKASTLRDYHDPEKETSQIIIPPSVVENTTGVQ